MEAFLGLAIGRCGAAERRRRSLVAADLSELPELLPNGAIGPWRLRRGRGSSVATALLREERPRLLGCCVCACRYVCVRVHARMRVIGGSACWNFEGAEDPGRAEVQAWPESFNQQGMDAA